MLAGRSAVPHVLRLRAAKGLLTALRTHGGDIELWLPMMLEVRHGSGLVRPVALALAPTALREELQCRSIAPVSSRGGGGAISISTLSIVLSVGPTVHSDDNAVHSDDNAVHSDDNAVHWGRADTFEHLCSCGCCCNQMWILS